MSYEPMKDRKRIIRTLENLLEALEFARTREKPAWCREYLFGKRGQPQVHDAITKARGLLFELSDTVSEIGRKA